MQRRRGAKCVRPPEVRWVSRELDGATPGQRAPRSGCDGISPRQAIDEQGLSCAAAVGHSRFFSSGGQERQSLVSEALGFEHPVQGGAVELSEFHEESSLRQVVGRSRERLLVPDCRLLMTVGLDQEIGKATVVISPSGPTRHRVSEVLFGVGSWRLRLGHGSRANSADQAHQVRHLENAAWVAGAQHASLSGGSSRQTPR